MTDNDRGCAAVLGMLLLIVFTTIGVVTVIAWVFEHVRIA